MVATLCCISLSQDCLNLISLALGLFAAIIAVGYFLRPRLFYCVSLTKEKCKVRTINKNLFFTIKEIRCEISLSTTKEFRLANTLDLKKPDTLMLQRFCITESDYVFHTTSNIEITIDENSNKLFIQDNEMNKSYQYLRIRLLAPNFLGIKKHYERIFKISNLTLCVEETYHCKPISQCSHKSEQKKDLT